MSTRPPLPLKFANPLLNNFRTVQSLPPVKYQILNCQGKDILVGRLKIDTPNDVGHAFILRRFDTGAISLTTMFRAAFPDAPEEDEKAEVQWVKDTHDLTGNNGTSKDSSITRLAGVWVSPDLAVELAASYSLQRLINVVVNAQPDPKGTYRKSGKKDQPMAAPSHKIVSGPNSGSPQAALPQPPSAAAKSLPTPSPTGPATKRRREASPAASSATSAKPPSSSRASPAIASPAAKPSGIPTFTPRRSTRASQSPGPRPPSSAGRTRVSTRKSAVVATSSTTIVTQELEPVEEDQLAVEDHVAGAELREQDVKEQKKLIADLKAKRDAMKQESEEGEDDSAHADMAVDNGSPSKSAAVKKRVRQDEEEALKFEFKEPEVTERAIATNRRVSNWTPQGKSVAWGLAAFAVGMGAISFLPNFF